jgi:hypothetical protein
MIADKMRRVAFQWLGWLVTISFVTAILSSRVHAQSLERDIAPSMTTSLLEPHSDAPTGYSPPNGIFHFSMQGTTDPGTEQEIPSAATAPASSSQPADSPYPPPFLADLALKRGYDLPLPFGVSSVYTYLQRDIKIHDLRIGLNGAPPQSVSDFVNVGSRVKVNAGMGRFDVFMFPFLDVYGLLGYLSEETTTSGIATIRLPGPGGRTRTVSFSGVTPVDGVLTGIGATSAIGYKQFFAALDVNYTVVDLGFDDRFSALLTTLRTGWNGKVGKVPMRIWTGAQYWDSAGTAASTITLAGGDRLSFQADQGPKNPFNMVFGTSLAVSKHLGLLVEYGTNFDDMQMAVGGLEFRF